MTRPRQGVEAALGPHLPQPPFRPFLTYLKMTEKILVRHILGVNIFIAKILLITGRQWAKFHRQYVRDALTKGIMRKLAPNDSSFNSYWRYECNCMMRYRSAYLLLKLTGITRIVQPSQPQSVSDE